MPENVLYYYSDSSVYSFPLHHSIYVTHDVVRQIFAAVVANRGRMAGSDVGGDCDESQTSMWMNMDLHGAAPRCVRVLSWNE